MYNLTNITDANDFLEIAVATNRLTGDLYSGVILLALFLVAFMVFQNHPTKVVFIGASFLVSVVAALFFFSGFASWRAVVLPVVLLFVSIIIYVLTE